MPEHPSDISHPLWIRFYRRNRQAAVRRGENEHRTCGRCSAAAATPARQTLEAIEAAGFDVERCERFGFSPSPIIPRLPHILGVARRP